VTTFMAKGALPADHPLMVTTIGLVAEDIEKWAKVIRAANIKPE